MTHVSPPHDHDHDAPDEGARPAHHADQHTAEESSDERVLDERSLDEDGSRSGRDGSTDDGVAPTDGARTERPTGDPAQPDGTLAEDGATERADDDRSPGDEHDLESSGRHAGGQHAAAEPQEGQRDELFDDGTPHREHTLEGVVGGERPGEPAEPGRAVGQDEGEPTAPGVAAVPESTTYQSSTARPDADGRAEVAAASGAADGSATAQQLWPAEHRADIDQRWRDAQVSFVDDPAAAVSTGRGLATSALQAVTETLHAGGEHSGDTEELRQQMRRYRKLLDTLGSL